MHISSQFLLLGVTAAVDAAAVKPRGTSTIPDYLQTSYGPFAGPTQAGSAPFLAQTNAAPAGKHSYVPNTPVVTDVPILGKGDGAELFEHMGNLSPYMPNPSGFGVEEYSLPPGSNITQMHMVHRHGSRYPTSSASVATLPKRIAELLGNGTRFTGNLEFLNTWEYQLGKEELTGLGRQQLFDSGVLHWFNYGQLYDPSSPLIARTCSQVRMLQSAENFLNGFFGPKYADNVTLEVIIEQTGFKNPLAGDKACTNNNNNRSAGGDWANTQWQEKYLKRATDRFRESMTGNKNWTTEDTYLAQTMCPYETVGLGYSPFCSLFTKDEWDGFEYSFALEYYGENGFGSPTGRAVGVGYVHELVARLQHQYPQPDEGFTAINETLDTNPTTFPLNQSLYLDFSHDTTMFSMLTALGLTQFEDFLPTSGPPEDNQLIVSHIVPFAARFNIEVIKAPRPVRAKRSKDSHTASYEDKGGETIYVHLLINQRTISLGRSIPECGKRDDGWCELETFIKAQKENIAKAKYEDSCFGNYSVPAYGDITTGAI
ncbi:Histidine phosphatase superfamily clade-2 [Penicillium subrubescens]|uniref:Histidine phosphatase superfamily clade-2 n=1 Tax=Penicillium subrubescens TaxID=1316194 RepID=UPI00254583D0|nr:Histidine phosphatase superfamily clade-2 [Penicillium subrubescens]KAJ5873420.1 Histidine phosphatase superfamily clade-2 [Penicillium subrubescens]